MSEPRFGRAALGEFLLAAEFIHLNHGSYGAVPRHVLAEQDRLRAHIERDATTYFQDEFPQAIRRMAGVAASHFGGSANDWVFCENATAAVNSILASLPLLAGDELVTTSHAYGAVAKAMRIWAERCGGKVVRAEIPSIVESEDEIVAAIEYAFTPRTKLLVTDHITSATAIVFPVARIVEAAHRANVPVLIDGAHAPGHIALDVPSIGAEWYAGNAHKWLFAPKGCGLLWTAPAQQDLTRPAVLSHGSPDGYTQAFDWIGTRDITPWLCLEAAIAAHENFGGAFLMARNRALADEGAAHVAGAFNGTTSAPPELRGAMASIRLGPAPAQPEKSRILRQRLVKEFGIVVPVFAFADQLWVRISAQIYNEIEDYDRLAGALRKALSGA